MVFSGGMFDPQEPICDEADLFHPEYRTSRWLLYFRLESSHAAREPHEEVKLVKM